MEVQENIQSKGLVNENEKHYDNPQSEKLKKEEGLSWLISSA